MKFGRLLAVAMVLALAFGLESGRAAGAQSAAKTYVLVHGAYGGGWIWRDVAEGLRKRGHRVVTPTQTGLGERSHLLSRQITADTHIDDVANVIETDELTNVILVGHSYGGVAVTGVADRMPDRIRHVVYLDALIPENGETAFQTLPAGAPEARRKAAQEQGGGVALPVPGADAFPIPAGPGKDWFMRRLRPHPIGTYESVVTLKKPAGAGLPVTYVAYTNPALASIEPSRQRAKAKAGWTYKELAVPHDVEIPNPEKVVELLAAIE